MPLKKKNFVQFIFKEKSGAVTKLKLVYKSRNQKSKKINQLCFGTLVLTSYCDCGDNAQNTNFLQNTGFKESNNMAVNTISK